MYTNNAYLNNSVIDKKDKSKPLIVTSCGTYKLYTNPKFSTLRPRGRIDFQLLYIASGKAHFHFDKETDTIVTAGNMILYRPKEPQRYEYYGEDQTEVYWVHFTGRDVTNILHSYGFKKGQHVFYCGLDPIYSQLFRAMINELQMCKSSYEEMLEMHLRQLLIRLQRYFFTSFTTSTIHVAEEIDRAMIYFNEHYNEPISIDEYAKKHNMSTSGFIRNFKLCTGSAPMHYILSKRIYNAEVLLKDSAYNVSEIARIVGYDNPLYFSRVFKKMKGIAPSDYRKNIKN